MAAQGTGSGSSAGDTARRLAAAGRRAAQSATAAAWPHVRDRVEARTGPGARLARQLAREAEQSRRAHAAAVQRHADAVARRDRVVRRSRRAVPTWSVVGTGAALAAVPVDGGATALLVAVAGGSAARVAVAVRRLVRPPAVPPAPVPQQGPPPPPPARSVAFPYVVRLEHARAALHRLLPLVVPAGREVAEEAWAAAASADTSLRWCAARLAAAEPHRGADAAVLADLEAGVVAQERLVQGVADLVAAGADPHGAARLQDVTDRLHGLAAGLREVRS